MIREIKGDLIKLAEQGDLDMIVHGCNTIHAMRSGIAGQLARRYPEVARVDQEGTIRGDFSKIGTFTIAACHCDLNTFWVVNGYTQKEPSYDGSDVFEYQGFRQICNTLKSEIESASVTSPTRIGFPHIGAGLAGGDWNQIKQIIIDVFGECKDISVTIVEWSENK